MIKSSCKQIYASLMDFRRDAERGRRQECTQKYMTAATEFCNKAENSLAKRILYLFSLPFLLLIGLIGSQFCFAKDISHLYSSSYFSSTKEQQMTDEYLQTIMQSNALLTDLIISDYVQSLGKRLVKASQSAKTFNFFVVNDPTVNAFAGPGGYIGVNSGLILMMQTEDELAAVLAHEIAHVTQNHLSRSIEAQKQSRIPAYAAAIGAIALGAINPALASGALAATTAAYYQNAINFTRAHEREADRIGMQILQRAGFSPQAMPQAFQHMSKVDQLYPNEAPEILRTHPQSYARIADTQNRAAQTPDRPTSKNLLFNLVQARARVITAKDPTALVDYFRDTRNRGSQNQQIANQYGNMLTQLTIKNIVQAKEQAQQLVQAHPNQSVFAMSLAEIESDSHHQSECLQILHKAYVNHPDYFPLLTFYARNLLDSGDAGQAQKLLSQRVADFPHKPVLYYLLARAYGNTDNLVEAYLTQAQFYKLLGDPYTALQQLNQAARLPNLSADTKAIIEARMQQLKKAGHLESYVFA